MLRVDESDLRCCHRILRSSQLTFFFYLFGHQELVALDGGGVITPDDPDGVLKLMCDIGCREKSGEFMA